MRNKTRQFKLTTSWPQQTILAQNAALDDERQPPDAQPTPVSVVVGVGVGACCGEGGQGRAWRRAGAGMAAGQGGPEFWARGDRRASWVE